MLESARLPDGREFRIPGVVPKLTETPGGTEWLGPRLGEHTDAILADLEFSAAEIEKMRQNKAI